MNRLLKLFSGIILFVIFVQCEDVNPQSPNEDDTIVEKDPNKIYPVEGEYANCLNELSESTLDIATWNIQKFSESNTDFAGLKDMVLTMDADIIAVQEITSSTDFDLLLSELNGWEGAIINQGGLSTGYLYKTSEISLIGSFTTIYDDDGSAFPRAPLIGNFNHISGTSVILINLHLKCCGGSTNEQRRKDASEKIKLYVDTNLADEPVIVLGDFNDEIQETPELNVFQNIINDEENYLFTDMEVALGSSEEFSYPSWPSHLDHILITNELFEDWDYTRTIKLDDCYGSYEVNVSDHRPVLARFNTN